MNEWMDKEISKWKKEVRLLILLTSGICSMEDTNLSNMYSHIASFTERKEDDWNVNSMKEEFAG